MEPGGDEGDGGDSVSLASCMDEGGEVEECSTTSLRQNRGIMGGGVRGRARCAKERRGGGRAATCARHAGKKGVQLAWASCLGPAQMNSAIFDLFKYFKINLN
jgi:hypothetical protein